MPTRTRQSRRWLVILLIALLAPLLPGKMNLCLLPGGEMHLEVGFAIPCGLADQHGQTGEAGGEQLCRLNAGAGPCLDFTLGENAPHRQYRSLCPPSAAGLVFLPRPLDLFPAGQLRPQDLSPAPAAHLRSQRTTVLRI